MTKRGNGEGSIAKHATRDLWMARWTEEVQGRTVRRTIYAKSKEEAVAKLRAATIRVEAGQPGIDSATPFKTVAEQWRRTAQISQGISSRSMQTYSGVLRLHVYPVIGHVPLKAVKPSHVTLVLASMSEKGLSRAYQHQAHKAISGVFKMAIDDELVVRNPTLAVKAPRGGHQPKVVPTRKQVLTMISRAPDARMRTFVAVLAYSGLRISEALGLRWQDWDGAGTMRVMTTKGGRPRAIPVPEKLQVELKAWRKAQLAEQMAVVWWDTEHDWILSTDVGTHWDAHNARKRFRLIANGDPEKKREGICPGATPHSLRHATATILLEEGVPMRVVSELLGHSSTRITEDVYSHVTARLAEESAAALDRAL
jgi:integrase